MKNNKEKTPMMLVVELSHITRKYLAHSGEKKGLSETYRPFIFALSLKNMTQNELVEYTRFAAPTVSLTIRKMESEGYVEINQSTTDSRTKIVSLTEKGKKLVKEYKKHLESFDEQVLSAINEEEKTELKNILEKLRDKVLEMRDDNENNI